MRLEVGPGYTRRGRGYRFNPHYEPGYDVVYLDVNQPDFKLSRSTWVVADAQNLPFRSSSIDEVFSAHVIEHLEKPMKFLEECRRVLKRGGVVTIETPNFLSKYAYLDPDHKHVFNIVKLWVSVRKAGLRPRFPPLNIGSLIPQKLRLLIRLVLLLLSDNLTIRGVKE